MSSNTLRLTNEPNRKAVVVVPSDSFDLAPNHARAIWVGVAGDLAVIPAGNDDASPVTFKAVPAGEFKSVGVRRVLSTGTTATNLLALS